MNLPVKQIVETDYEVKLGVFEGPLDLLLYLVQKNELNPREISISAITDQYLAYIDAGLHANSRGGYSSGGLKDLNLSNAGEFLVMASRLMRLKARELLPADQKDELEEMEYELDRQALIQQMLEYQKFKEAARVLRNFEGKNFGAFARGRDDVGEEKTDAETEEEAGIFDLLTAFRAVVMQRPKMPVHEVEIDDVTIEDKMQEVEIILQERGRSLFEDLFAQDQRTIAQVVTFMAILELCKLDRAVFRQSHGMGAIWIYQKARSRDFEMELKLEEMHLDPLPDFKPGLVEIVQAQIKQRAVKNALEEALRELELGLNPDAEAKVKELQAQAEAHAAVQALTAGESADAETPGAAGETAGAETVGLELSAAETQVLEVVSEVGGEIADAAVVIEQNAVIETDDEMITAEKDPIAHAALQDLVQRMREMNEDDNENSGEEMTDDEAK